jgi:hypothetical protein
MYIMRYSSIENRRVDQIRQLGETEIEGSPVLIVGSLGHAAVVGVELPVAVKKDRSLRDIDVFAPGGLDKVALEEGLHALSLDTPSPLDGGASSLIRHEANGVYASRGGVVVELEDAGILDEVVEYPIKGSEDLRLRSLSPLGMLALHSLEPVRRILFHRKPDGRFADWFHEQGLSLPPRLERSITEFKQAYSEKYPHATVLRHLSKAYVQLTPEFVRSRARTVTHPFMQRHTGRQDVSHDQGMGSGDDEHMS